MCAFSSGICNPSEYSVYRTKACQKEEEEEKIKALVNLRGETDEKMKTRMKWFYEWGKLLVGRKCKNKHDRLRRVYVNAGRWLFCC